MGNAQEYASRSNALTILKNGNTGIGTHTPQTYLHINQKSVSTGIRLEYISTSYWDTYVDVVHDYNFAFNNILKSYILDTDGSYIAVSDRNLKTDITPFSPVLEKVKQLQPCHYRFKDDMSGGNKSIGLIAQEVEPLFPEVVHEKDGIKAINYDAFAVIAIQAIKEQQEIIEALQSRLEELEKKEH
ncbi:MAG: tail fiber domain-containing protein [Bacteroidales bacterium]|nr:tail fiber domain-containing protein [Bacteroidales bacterium]